MKKINWNRFTYKVNHDFFKTWTPQMAYILGFTFADGNVYNRTLAWDLKEDKELLLKINRAMDSTYPIKRGRASYRLRMHNPVIIHDIQKLGVNPNKTRNCRSPKISKPFQRHFIRGVFDGDGWIYMRKKRNEISTGFSNGSRSFLEDIVGMLNEFLNLTTNHVRERRKITRSGKKALVYQLDYYCTNALKILKFMYGDLIPQGLFMERKYKKYLEAKEFYEYILSGGRKYREVQKKYGDMKDLLYKLLIEEGLDGVQIAKKLGVHSSSIYRWLAKTGVRVQSPKKSDG